VIEQLAALQAAFVASGILVATAWFFGGYQRREQNKVLGNAVFGFILSICASRVWFLTHTELGHQPATIFEHHAPQALVLLSLVFLLVMAGQCNWLGGRWWTVVAAAGIVAFSVSQAI
jgi:hypothetical protein